VLAACVLAALVPLVDVLPIRAQSGAGAAVFDEVWQTVNDTYFDPAFGGLDWAAVRRELRPQAEHAPDEEALRAVIRAMLARLGQSHFALLAPTSDPLDVFGAASAPIDVRPAEEGMLVTELRTGPGAAAPAIALGERLIAIDGRDVAASVALIDHPNPRMRDLLAWRRVMAMLSGDPGTAVMVRMRTPAGVEHEVRLVRRIEDGTAVAVGNLPAMRVHLSADEARTSSGRRVGVIGFNVWMTTIAEPFAAAIDRFRQADGLVIDLRGNPGGLADMMRGLGGHLVSEPVLIGRMRMREADLEFRANPRRSTSDGRRVEPYAGPVAVLVDGMTGSASECFAGGLQSLGRVRVFGTTSMGQALPASTKTLSNGDVLMYAVGDFVTSTGLRLEGRGVVPDEIVPLTSANLAAGRDARAAALAWLDTARRP
jgi:carboxyl-terminal processing protease